MEAINSRNQVNIRGIRIVNIRGIRIIIFIRQAPIVESIDKIFRNFNFGNGSGLLQFWACTPSNSEDMGCNLMLTDQTFMSTPDEGLQVYRRRCLENRYRFVGLETSVGNWIAGRAAQTRIADHWTIHHVVNQEDQHSIDIGGKGQLVLPVFFGQDAGNKLAGIIEFVTPVPKESYVEDFEQIHDLLKDEGLKSEYLGKTIKVEYNDMIKFTLPLSAKFTDLHSKVTERFTDLEHQEFRVEYNDTQGNRLPISSDEDLRVCMAESSSKGAKFIRMYVLLNT
ncbi:putative PB1 domain-containing protein [Helianthus annuus]|nr:putative PB1 domain-containing protein [Helianthus annuus]KAJ0446116.1 putative PB1 domain-containing protein [Helianthus annuus]KAJ0631076.1 putative PB1 domain-containing protein [Helianthus annuus]KAJ0634954.1 putative PB1 domain-containing protein [Helianthus annuus]KAJ0824664.1 putative PB1 domain-containing protein [Helianthus annuus]